MKGNFIKRKMINLSKPLNKTLSIYEEFIFMCNIFHKEKYFLFSQIEIVIYLKCYKF
jgi:hypothetical protein